MVFDYAGGLGQWLIEGHRINIWIGEYVSQRWLPLILYSPENTLKSNKRIPKVKQRDGICIRKHKEEGWFLFPCQYSSI
jgi:hypothetical protein